jgi:hypothetical protein
VCRQLQAVAESCWQLSMKKESEMKRGLSGDKIKL